MDLKRSGSQPSTSKDEPGDAVTYTTKELTAKTWRDFEKLFSQGNGWDFCWCIHFQRPHTLPKSEWRRTRAERGARNKREKKALVKQGRAHGILVYGKGEPLGWCQYGPKEELPRIEGNKNYRALGLNDSAKKLWRITCFVVDKKHRQCGVATVALKAALEAIRKRGGGVVEAYPIIPWEELCRARVRRCGHAPAFGNESTHGTLSMFEKQGFKKVGPYGLNNVVVRKTVTSARLDENSGSVSRSRARRSARHQRRRLQYHGARGSVSGAHGANDRPAAKPGNPAWHTWERWRSAKGSR